MSKIEPREFVLKDGRKCIIRTAEEADAEKVLKQIESVLAEAEYTITTLDNDREDYTIEKINERIKKHIENEGNLFVVAEIDEQIIASTDLHNGVRKRIEHVGTVAITVVRDFRGLGIGEALMQSIIDWASNNPIIEKMGLGVFANNIKAISLYKKLGFVEEGRKAKEIKIAPDKYVDSILMYKFVK